MENRELQHGDPCVKREDRNKTEGQPVESFEKKNGIVGIGPFHAMTDSWLAVHDLVS
jgi:hypothetical protein